MRTVTEEDEEISRMSNAKLPSIEDKTEKASTGPHKSILPAQKSKETEQTYTVSIKESQMTKHRTE